MRGYSARATCGAVGRLSGAQVANQSDGGMKMVIEIKKSHEGRFHEWAKVPNGQEIPMSKIKQGERSPDPRVRKEAHFADNARHWNHKG
jgi:hypothetical protein